MTNQKKFQKKFEFTFSRCVPNFKFQAKHPISNQINRYRYKFKSNQKKNFWRRRTFQKQGYNLESPRSKLSSKSNQKS